MKCQLSVVRRNPMCLLLAVALALTIALPLMCSAQVTPVARKGITLAGDPSYYTASSFSKLQDILNTGVGEIAYNLPWNQATKDCADTSCTALKPTNPTDWDDPQYANSPTVQAFDQIANYVATNAPGVHLIAITYGTPGWANCTVGGVQLDVGPNYPPQNASDYGDFMYAMSERYSGAHTSDGGLALPFVRDWIVYNEVNSPGWWMNTACNTAHKNPVYYYGLALSAAYTAVHHVSNPNVRVLAGALTSYAHSDWHGNANTRISTSYSDWNTYSGTGAWISPLAWVQEMYNESLPFDAIALHPYPVTQYSNPLLATVGSVTQPAGAVTMANVYDMENLLQSLYPMVGGVAPPQWHIALTEYAQSSNYGTPPSGWDEVPTRGCPNGYFCASTSEANLSAYINAAYSDGGSVACPTTGSLPPCGGSRHSYIDYLLWSFWYNISGHTTGLVRANGSDKNQGLGSGSVRQTFTNITATTP